ncbi:MAG TPA: hypothetical protein VJR89_25935 [Polyangiales bacterium]|nr:hypothetical protein [Polyangiales bacterium]
MRYSLQRKSEPKRLPGKRSNLELLQAVAKTSDAERGRGAILLVGRRDWRSIQVRRAQAPLRYDRRSSYFSHAALITDWDPNKPERSRGLEASLDPDRGAAAVPERNGVTPFRLTRYLDDDTYPNLALITLDLKATQEPGASGKPVERSGGERKRELIHAARNPCRRRDDFPLWDGIGEWLKYTYSPERTPNPLLQGVSLPGAAFCEYAYASIQIDITPAASNRQTCPELLWATFLRWQEGLLATSVDRIEILVVVRDEYGIAPEPLSMELGLR